MWSKGNWHVCFHVVIIMKKTVGDLSHMENCIHVQIWTLETHYQTVANQNGKQCAVATIATTKCKGKH